MLKIFKIFLFSIFLLELASLAGFFIPEIREAAFFGVLVIALVASLQRLEYGLYILFAELAIGSKGYLLWYAYDGIDISLRIGLFFTVLCVWLGKAILDWMSVEHAIDDIDPFLLRGKTWKELPAHIRDAVHGRPQRSGGAWGIYGWYVVLFAALGWSVLNGYLQGNGLKNIFLDANGWLYFAAIFPLAQVLKRRNGEEAYAERLAYFWRGTVAAAGAGVAWLTIKTLILLYLFSHNLPYALETYRWIRVTGVGEITRLAGDFHRIFLQSHVYIFMALFGGLALLLWLAIQRRYRQLAYWSVAVTGLWSVVILGFSRSFWAGLGAGLLIYGVATLWLYRREWKSWLLHAGVTVITALMSVVVIWGIVAFPFPDPTAYFDASLIRDRTTDMDDAAASSRWQLLPVLWDEITEAPLQGKGFGETVTYISDDPRVREQNPSGEYTTFAFEWGWLDMWLKLGLVGLSVYVGLLAYITYQLLKKLQIADCRLQISEASKVQCQLSAVAFLAALGFLAATHTFSPYLNHPLGIGFIVAAGAWVQQSTSRKH